MDGEPLDGRMAFTLYDTYGFPLDLTQDILRGQGRVVDTDGFDTAMEEQRAKARANWAGSGEAATETVWFGVREQAGVSEFLGYETEHAEGVVAALVKDGAPVDSIAAGDEAVIIANQTPFYGESGGQVGDTGTITGVDGQVFTVTDTQKKVDDLILHHGRLESGSLTIDDVLDMQVDGARRSKLRWETISVTHLMHEALRRVFGRSCDSERVSCRRRNHAL